ncbi:NAD(P)H-binding protein [Streptomyces sp. NPDC097727]|uniref:NAD(P)H-binding protein n=1 Tax=Streptomyces sp. NPDC097727 TaxID=3366092 RepID=UPI0038046A5B
MTGATSTVGRSLIDQLLNADAPVRAVTRHPSTAHLPPGVDVVQADLGDPAGLPAVLEGVDRVFLLSNGPATPEHDANLTHAAARAGATHLVKLSSGRVDDSTATDPIPTWHRAGEQAVRDSGLAWTMLRPLGFMSNALHWADTVREHDTVYAPHGQSRIALIDPRDIAAVAAAVLTTGGHEGRVYRLTGPEALSPVEQVGILAEVLGRPLRHVETSPAAARQAILDQGVPAAMTDAIMALRAAALEPFTSVLHPDVEEVTGTPARTFRDWALRHRAVFEPSSAGSTGVTGRKPVRLLPGEPGVFDVPGNPYSVKLTGEQSAGTLAVLQSTFAPGEGAPLHRHQGHDETFYVVSGAFRFRSGEDITDAGPGTFFHIPRTVPHAFTGIGDEPNTLLVMLSPAGFEHFFIEAMTHPNPATIQTMLAKYDQELLPD